MYDSRTNQFMSKIKLLEKSIQKQVALTIYFQVEVTQLNKHKWTIKRGWAEPSLALLGQMVNWNKVKLDLSLKCVLRPSCWVKQLLFPGLNHPASYNLGTDHPVYSLLIIPYVYHLVPPITPSCYNHVHFPPHPICFNLSLRVIFFP